MADPNGPKNWREWLFLCIVYGIAGLFMLLALPFVLLGKALDWLSGGCDA